MKLILVPPGRGRWSQIVLSFDERRHRNLPPPIVAKPDDRIEINGRTYRVQQVRA